MQESDLYVRQGVYYLRVLKDGIYDKKFTTQKKRPDSDDGHYGQVSGVRILRVKFEMLWRSVTFTNDFRKM